MTINKYDRTYVAFLDILGFKELVDNNDHDVLDEIYNWNIADTIEACRSFLRNGVYNDEYESENIEFLAVSDSIILWSNEYSDMALVNLLIAVRAMMYTSILKGVPLRGGISVGPLSVVKNEYQMSLYGKGLTKAYSIEGNQDWSGCIVESECFETLTDKQCLEILLENTNSVISKYYVPKKHGRKKEEYAINWVPFFSGSEEEAVRIITDSFSEHKKNVDDWSISRKIQNTIEFYYAMVRQAP